MQETVKKNILLRSNVVWKDYSIKSPSKYNFSDVQFKRCHPSDYLKYQIPAKTAVDRQTTRVVLCVIQLVGNDKFQFAAKGNPVICSNDPFLSHRPTASLSVSCSVPDVSSLWCEKNNMQSRKKKEKKGWTGEGWRDSLRWVD